jgi:hypothetical protein
MADLMIPVLVVEGYRGFNILQVAQHEFVALSQDEGAYFPQKLASGGYKRVYVGHSLEAVKAEVAAETLTRTLEEIMNIFANAAAGRFSRGALLQAAWALRGKWVSWKLVRATKRAKRPEYPVKLVEEDYLGFNILQIGPQTFVALGQGEGEFSRKKLDSGRYELAFVAGSVEEAKAKVVAVSQGATRAFAVQLVEEACEG